jgi:energy-coupling factor transport system permease protein
MKPLYQFSAGNSFLHQLDPRSKLFFLVCFLIPLWTLPLPYPVIMGLAMILVIWVVGRIKPSEYLVFILFMIPIMFAVILIQVFGQGPPFYYLTLGETPIIRISLPGLDLGLRVAFRLAAMGIGFIGFSMSTDPFHWGMSFYKSGLPYKPAFMFGFAMRFFPLLQEELGIIRDALKARAFENIVSKNLLKKLQGIAVIITPLGLSALRRSQSIALAMELRGYNIPDQTGIKRTLYRKIGFGWRDGVVCAISCCLLASTFYL